MKEPTTTLSDLEWIEINRAGEVKFSINGGFSRSQITENKQIIITIENGMVKAEIRGKEGV